MWVCLHRHRGLWPCRSPANKAKLHQKPFATTASPCPWNKEQAPARLPRPQALVWVSAVLPWCWSTASRFTLSFSVAKLYSLRRVASSRFAGASVPPLQQGRERRRRGTVVPSRAQHLHGILSRCTAHRALHLRPCLPRVRAWKLSPCRDKHHRLSKPSTTPERSGGGKEEKTPPFQWLWLVFSHVYLLGTVMVCFHL